MVCQKNELPLYHDTIKRGKLIDCIEIERAFGVREKEEGMYICTSIVNLPSSSVRVVLETLCAASMSAFRASAKSSLYSCFVSMLRDAISFLLRLLKKFDLTENAIV